MLCRTSGAQGLGDGAIIEPIQLAAHRNAARQHGHRYGIGRARQTVGQIVGCGLPIHRRWQGQDHLAHIGVDHPRDQFLYAQSLWPDAVQRG